MRETVTEVSMMDLVLCLAQAVDSVSPAVADHHKRVAYIVSCLAEELKLPEPRRRQLTMAGLVHDVGGLQLQERLDIMQFDAVDIQRHAEVGYDLLRTFGPFERLAAVVRFHHVPWNNGRWRFIRGASVPEDSHLLNLADRAAVLVNTHAGILGQTDHIRAQIWQQAERLFKPEHVAAFMNVGRKEVFWFDLVSRSLEAVLKRRQPADTLLMNGQAMLELAKMFSAVIDFRSHFTATHSSGVAASAESLARLQGFTPDDCWLMRMAGYLHDLGKLGVPPAILEKNGKLTKEETDLVRMHPYLTSRILEHIESFDTIRAWGSQHHERLDGSGYPCHLTSAEISAGSRIMAVADTFVALSEDRPYRAGMPREQALGVLHEMTRQSALDAGVVVLLEKHFDEVNSRRAANQRAVAEQYRRVVSSTAATGPAVQLVAAAS